LFQIIEMQSTNPQGFLSNSRNNWGHCERTSIMNPVKGMRGSSEQDLPTEFYIPLVDSLYKEERTLLLGFGMVVGSVLLTYWKTGQASLLVCVLALAGVACARMLDMRAFARQPSGIKDIADARRWELRYVAGSAATMLLLGSWCYLSVAQTSDPFAQLVSFSMTIAYSVGISGRNFGSSRLVTALIWCTGLPMVAALLLHGDIYHWVFAGLLSPFFLAVKFISDRLRRTLLDAVIATRDVTLLANRFDTALNNMPHGLCMFDAERRIVVANQKLSDQLGLPADLQLKQLGPRQLIACSVEFGTLSDAEGDEAARALETRLSGDDSSDFFAELRSASTLEFTVQPMENGGMVLLVEDITERKLAEAKINHLARFDPLTGLPNRTILRHRMEDVLAHCDTGDRCAVHFIDLDQFKQVNDTLGHPRGDMLLQAVADRLRATVGSSDMVARFGGDEFVVLQSTANDPDKTALLASRILKSLGASYKIDGKEVAISASIGIAFAPKDGIEADQLLKKADMALYRAKAESRDTWRFFKPDMEARAQARRKLELDLRNAVETDTFEIYYQPILDLKTRRVLACEALLRWPHPERGMISPSEFVPVAEEMGIIAEIDKRVLRTACLECRQWPREIRVAVNLSPIQFGRTNIPLLVHDALAGAGLPAHRLEIEITETTLLTDTVRCRSALHQLQALGVGISLDDFGTKYSNLSYLHSFPLRKVKIDQSFVKDLATNSRMVTLLRGVARMSADLGLRLVVEGVETDEQLLLISAVESVDEVQGYLFAPPLPASAIRKLLRAAPVQIERVA
jgi:diguanylate cyclase (GGDEF)-like protein